MHEVIVEHDLPLFAVGDWGPLAICRCVGPPIVEHLYLIREHHRKMIERFPKIVRVTVVEPRSMLNFDDKARRTSARLQAEMHQDMLASCQVVRAPGFLSSILRSIMLGVTAMSRPPYPTRVCPSLQEAANFLSEELIRHDIPLQAPDLNEAIETFLGKLAPTT